MQTPPAALTAALNAQRGRASYQLILGTDSGANVVQNPGFDSVASWTVGANHTISGGVLSCSGAGTTYQNITKELESGQRMWVTFDQTAAAGTTVTLRFYDVLGNEVATLVFEPESLNATTETHLKYRSATVTNLGGGWVRTEVLLTLGDLCQTVRVELTTGATATSWDNVTLTFQSADLTTRVLNYNGSRRTRRMVQDCEIVLNNSDGLLLPFNQDSTYYQLCLQGRRVKLCEGLDGGNVDKFTGYVSKVRVIGKGRVLRLLCSSVMKRAFRKVTDPATGLRYGTIAGPIALEEVVRTLAKWMGWPDAKIHVDTTGVVLQDGYPFNNISYAAALEYLSGLVNYLCYDDEAGEFWFKFPRGANTVTETPTLNGTTPASLANAPIAGGAVVTYSGTEMTLNVDYTLDLRAGTITRIAGGGIPDGGTVTIQYVPIVWVFMLGEDLDDTEQTLDDEDLDYAQHFISENGLTSDYDYPNRETYGIMPGKESWFKTGTVPDQARIDQIASSFGRGMAGRANEITWRSPGVSHLQIRDVTQPYDPRVGIKDAYMLKGYAFSYNGVQHSYTWEASYFDSAAVPA